MGIIEPSSQFHHRRPRPSDIMLEPAPNTYAFANGVLKYGNMISAESRWGMPPSPASTPTKSSPKKRKAITRRVSFGPAETLACIETSSEMSQEDKICQWFQSQELEDIKAKARELCAQESKGVDVSQCDESTRGMDVYFPSRQRFNRKFIDHVLEAYHYRCAGNSEQVRLLVERWSAKSRKRAMDKAQQDYHEAYPS
jgi:hypothetical protein